MVQYIKFYTTLKCVRVFRLSVIKSDVIDVRCGGGPPSFFPFSDVPRWYFF